MISPWTGNGLKVNHFGKFRGTRLISWSACLTSADLYRPPIELQLSGDPDYDRMKRSLLQSRGESSSESRLGWIKRRVSGWNRPATRNPEDILREDIQFIDSLHLATSKPHEQRTANDIKQTAARILDRRAKETINAFISTLKYRLKMYANEELDHSLTQNFELKNHDRWNILRIELVEELEKLNTSPGIS